MILKLKNISKNYFSKNKITYALKDINLEVNDNEFIAIVGPSGCGKSTLLSIIGNLENRSNGEISTKDNIKIGYMFQEDALFPWLTVLDNCLLGLKIKKELTTINMTYVKTLLKKYGLSKFEKSFPKELSGGM